MARELNITTTDIPSRDSLIGIANKIYDIETLVTDYDDVNYGDSTGGAAEVFTLTVTAGATVAGTATITINDIVYNLPLTIGTTTVNSGEIFATLTTSLAGLYTVVATSGTVNTVTSLTKGAQTNATYSAGTATSSAATVAVTVAGSAATAYEVIVNGASPFEVYKFDLMKTNFIYEATYLETAANPDLFA